MEQTRIEEQIYTNYEEMYAFVLWPAFLLLMLEVILGNTRLRKFP